MDKEKVINISFTTGTVIKIVLIFLLLYFLYLISDILAILFVSLILASAFDPWVDWMQSKKIPRAAGILFIYLVLAIVIGSSIYLIIPPIAQQIGELSNDFPKYLDKIISEYRTVQQFTVQHSILNSIRESLGSVSSNLQKAATSIFSTVTGIFGGIFSFFLIVIITFYMVVEENAIKKLIWSVAPSEHQPYLIHLVNRMQKKIGLWLRGQLMVSLAIFLLDFIGLTILGVKYALILGLIGGIAEVVPYVGPILAAIPGVFIAFTQAPILALFAAVLYEIVHLIEGNILVPKIMEKAVGLNPIVSISVLLIGFKVGGIVGAVISIPVATAVSVFVKDIFDHKAAAEKTFDDIEKNIDTF